MAYEPGTVLPVRDGTAQGAAREREMLDAVGGADGIRQRIVLNPDGSTTTLRTRAGQPEFVTRGGGPSPGAPCLRGPFEEEAAQFAKRMWHDPLPDLVSSDGLFRIPRHPLRRIEVKAGEHEPKKLVEMHFASPSIDAQLSNHNPLALPILESAYGDRLWHPRQMARIVDKGLYFCMSRLRKLSLMCRKTNGKVPFVWWLSKESDPDLSGSLPICMNRNALETGLGTRLLHGLSQLKQFSIQVKNRVGAVITASPGGFLGGLDAPPVSGQPEFPAIVGDTGKVINNLSFAHSCGQPWHGWMTDAGIETRADLINFPSGRLVSPLGYVAPNTGYTRYFAIPGVPPVSTDVPDNFAYEGMEYLQDAIFFGDTLRYSPVTSAFVMGPRGWWHYSATTGKVHAMRMEIVGPVTWQAVTVKIHVDGELTVRGVAGPSRELGAVTITNHLDLSPLVAPHPTLWELKGHVSTGQLSYAVGSTGYARRFLFPLNVSPTGSRVLLLHYFTLNTIAGKEALSSVNTDPRVSSAWELVLEDDLSAVSFSSVWQLQANWSEGYRIPTFSYETYVQSFSHLLFVMPDYSFSSIRPLSGDYTLYAEYHYWKRGPIVHEAPVAQLAHHLVAADYATSGALVLSEMEYSWTPEAIPAFTDSYDHTGGSTLAAGAAPYVWGYHDATGDHNNQPDPTGNIAAISQHYTPGRWKAILTNPALEVSDVPGVLAPSWPGAQGFHNYEWLLYSNNVAFIPRLTGDVFAATEAVALASSIGYQKIGDAAYGGIGGTASYNPRTKEIRWSPGKLGCV